MDTLNSLKEFLNKDIFGFNGSSIIEEKLAVFPEWFFTARIGQPRAINITEIRTFSRSPWIQMVLNTKKKEISTIRWDVVEKDEESETTHEEDIKKVKDFLNNINTEDETIEDLASMAVTDLGEIDASVWVNVYSKGSYDFKDAPIIDDLGNINGSEKRLVLKPLGQRELLEVRPADAATFLKQIDIYRRLQGYYQYSFKNPRTNPIRFEPAEVDYLLMNKKSYAIYGFSPVQSIQQILELLIQSTRWNKDFYRNNAIPDGVMSFPGVDKKAMKKFKESWNSEVKGKPHKLLFVNVDSKFTAMAPNNRDMEWLEGQKWYHWLVFAVFGVSPVEAGFHENVSKGNTEGQERVTVKNAIKPDLLAIERVVNSKIIKEILQNENPEIVFKYFPKDHTLEKIEHDQSMQELDHNVLTINEYRRTKGRKPLDGGDDPIPKPSEDNNNNEEEGDEGSNPKDKKEEEENKSFKQKFYNHMEKIRG